MRNLILVIATIHLSGCYAIGYMGGRAVDNILIVDNQLTNRNQLVTQAKLTQTQTPIKLTLFYNSRNHDKVYI